jgi:AcrR family transcriptional regulator
MTPPSTRERLLEAASALFAEHGFRGAAVRDICDLARANPGAVSYHFGGKRQLYRSVLRQAVERLAAPPPPSPAPADAALPVRLQAFVRLLGQRCVRDPLAVRLLVRDLADGGTVAVEALAPVFRGVVEWLREALGQDDTPQATATARELVVAVGSPLVCMTVAWPLLERGLGLEPGHREALLGRLLERSFGFPPEVTS